MRTIRSASAARPVPASRRRLRRPRAASPAAAGVQPALTIRRATPDDAAAIARLAALDSSHVPAGDVLIAEVALEPWVAVSVDDGHVVADPFRPTEELVWLLIERSRQLHRSADGARDGHHGRGLGALVRVRGRA